MSSVLMGDCGVGRNIENCFEFSMGLEAITRTIFRISDEARRFIGIR
jgi:hypothetical protein